MAAKKVKIKVNKGGLLRAVAKRQKALDNVMGKRPSRAKKKGK